MFNFKCCVHIYFILITNGLLYINYKHKLILVLKTTKEKSSDKAIIYSIPITFRNKILHHSSSRTMGTISDRHNAKYNDKYMRTKYALGLVCFLIECIHSACAEHIVKSKTFWNVFFVINRILFYRKFGGFSVFFF